MSQPEHFKGKDALGHVAEAQARGLVSMAEIHGTEAPGYISAAADAARETALVILLLWVILTPFQIPAAPLAAIIAIFSLGWIVWKAGRSAWLGWARLERLHRIVAQEKWEIDNHRPQEREELTELYAAKGLEGKLLTDVIDVLMADDERLLKVMVEEELGLSLATHEHPLKQALGAFLGGLVATIICLLGIFIEMPYGILVAAALIIATAAATLAYHVQNKIIPAIVWNLGLASLSTGFVYFVLSYLLNVG